MIPKHVAIIMDGNGRWAKKQNKPRSYGHLIGSENVRRIAIKASEVGIKVLTLYAFSTENWKRPDEEVQYLMDLPAIFFTKYLDELNKRNIRVQMIGEIDKFPDKTRTIILDAIDKTKNNTALTLVFAINYGGKQEIVRGINNYVKDLNNNVANTPMSEELFNQYLYTKDYPEIDLMIRTSLDYRISNFLLWQLSYAEFVFIDKYWPEFSENDLDKCIEEFKHRQRRFGGV